MLRIPRRRVRRQVEVKASAVMIDLIGVSRSLFLGRFGPVQVDPELRHKPLKLLRYRGKKLGSRRADCGEHSHYSCENSGMYFHAHSLQELSQRRPFDSAFPS